MNHPAQPAPEGATRRPILMGQAIEIPNPNITPEVQAVLDNEGLYIGGDSKAPDHVIIPLWSQDGIVHSMKLDAPLAPERFLETVTFKGPYTPQSASPQDNVALRARCERLEGALKEISVLIPIQGMNPHAKMDDPIGKKVIWNTQELAKFYLAPDAALAQPEDGK